MSVREEFDKLKNIIADTEKDVDAVDKGKKAPGTRVRKAMQEIKAKAQEIRGKVLEASKNANESDA